jgi:hypothetical protein
MSPFEYVMVLVSIIVGLAITHVLTALSAAVHRLRGHGSPLRLEAVYLLWISFVLLWLISFWWWEFRFQELAAQWPFGLYLFIVGYSVSLFLLATILVPHQMEGISNSYDYFMDGRKWFFGGLLAVNGIDVIDTFLKGTEWGLRPVLWIQTGVYVVASIVGIVSTRRPVQVACAGAAMATQLWYMFREIGVLSR